MKILLIAFGLLVTTAPACGGRNPTGAIASAAGTGGASVIGGNGGEPGGGAGGGTNVGGNGGPSGNWACTVCRLGRSPSSVDGIIYDDGNRTVTADVSAAVTVSSIGVVSDLFIVDTEIVLASTTSSEHWTWRLRIPNLPGDLIRVGDSFDLNVSASQAAVTSQTIVLSRGGSLVVFTAHSPQTPLTATALDAWGISIADAGVLCEDDSSFPCVQRAHLASIIVEGDSATAVADQTVTVRDLSFSIGYFDEGCRGATALMGGFRPSSSGGIGGSSGAAGTGGAGGSGGTSGSGGAGGSGGRTASPYPACAGGGGPCDVAYGTIQDRNDQPVETPVTAAVTVSAIAREPGGNNNRVHITLADTVSAQRWTWTPAIPNLPATRINVGERFDLTVNAYLCGYIGASRCQTVVLARAGSLIAFSVDLLGAAGSAALPTLNQWGIALDDVGVFCESGGGAGGACGTRYHTARISVGTESVTAEPYHTVMIQGLSFSVGEFNHTVGSGTCLDVSPRTTMAGFRLP